nr:hypothetical protein [Escherichia coli]
MFDGTGIYASGRRLDV